MSFQRDDRNERETINPPSSSNKNTPTDKDKTTLEKTKVLPSQSAAQTNEGQQQQQQQQQQRQGMEVPNIKQTNKPQPNRPIAPAAAAASNVMPLGSPLGAGYMPQTMGFSHHPMMYSQIIRGQIGPMATQHYPHVPFGASSAAISASAHPKGIGQLRGTALPSATKLASMTSHLQGQPATLQSQTHTAVSAPTTRPSSPAVVIPSTSSVTTFQQQSTDHKATGDVRSPLLSDHTRRTGSPHCSSPTVQNTGAIITSAKTTIPTPLVPPHKPGQAIMLPHFTQGHNPLSASSYSQPAVSSSIQQAGIGTSVSMSISQHVPKPIQSVSVTVAAAMSKIYPSHMSIVPGRPGIQPTDGPASPDISRLSGKQSGPASPVAVQQHSVVSTVPSSAHVITASAPMQTSSVMDGRMERPHPGVTLSNPMLAANQMYPRYVFSEPSGGYPIPFPHSGFPQPIIRPPHTTTTVSTSGMQLLEPYMPATNNAIRNFGPGNMTNEALTSVAMMDSSGAGQGIYGMPVGMQQTSGLQIPISANNPNATSPRPSILRKRTSEGLRKPAVVPYNDGISSSSANEPTASPRSDSTLSAPQSGQSSPKPPSDSGSQAVEQQQQQTTVTSSTTTPKVEPTVTSQTVTESQVKIKKEQNELTPLTTVCTTVTSSMAVATTSSSTVEKPAAVNVALPDGASPRKKPRKQNVVVTEDKYGSSVPLEEGSSDEDEKKVKPQAEDDTVMDDDLKFILLKRPKISIFGGYRVNTKAAHNHFLKYSDVRIKEERKPTLQDIANQRGILHRVSGWRVHHIAAQMDDLSSVEQEVLAKLFEFRESLPKPRPGQKSKYHDELVMLDELVQGNIQRSQLVTEQLADIRKVMVKALDHRPRCVEILQKYINKRNPKKKS